MNNSIPFDDDDDLFLHDITDYIDDGYIYDDIMEDDDTGETDNDTDEDKNSDNQDTDKDTDEDTDKDTDEDTDEDEKDGEVDEDLDISEIGEMDDFIVDDNNDDDADEVGDEDYVDNNNNNNTDKVDDEIMNNLDPIDKDEIDKTKIIDSDDEDEDKDKKKKKENKKTGKKRKAKKQGNRRRRKRRKLNNKPKEIEVEVPPDVARGLAALLRDRINDMINNRWKHDCTREELKVLEPQYYKIDKKIKERRISEKDILKSNMSFDDQVETMEKFRIFRNLEDDTPGWLRYKRQLHKKVTDTKVMTDEDREVVKKIKESNKTDVPIHLRIIRADIPDNIKAVIWGRYEEIRNLHKNDSEYTKGYRWILQALNVPQNIIDIKEKYKVPFNLINKIYNSMEKHLYGQRTAKEKIIDMMCAMWSNSKTTKKMAGFYGKPGTGKTALARCLADAIGLPFEQISFGGVKDSSFLKGHGFTYVGSQSGAIVKALTRMKAKNGILFLDELDKIQDTRNGQEVASTLLHILDYTQNHEFKDEYLDGIPIDLSNLMIIIALNDTKSVDKVLLDRLELIEFKDYTKPDKIKIGYDYMIPNIMKDLNIDSKDVVITRKNIGYIISKSRIPEKGVRQLERNLRTIFSRFNTLKQLYSSSSSEKSIRLSYTIDNFKLPFEFNKKNIDKLFYEFGGKRHIPPIGLYM